MDRNWARAVLGGLAGTLVMTAVGLWTAPMCARGFPGDDVYLATLRGGDVLISGGYSDSNRNTAGIWRFSAGNKSAR